MIGFHDIGVTARVNADSTFAVDVPDFANDPALRGLEKGNFRISMADPRLAGFELSDNGEPWGRIPVASSYAPVVLRPVKRN